MSGPSGIYVGHGGDVCGQDHNVAGAGLDPVVQYSAAPSGLGRSDDRVSVEVLDIDEDESAQGHCVLFSWCDHSITYVHTNSQSYLHTQIMRMVKYLVKGIFAPGHPLRKCM